MSKAEVDVIDDPDMLLDDVDAQFDIEPSELSEGLTTASDMSDGEVEEARAAIAASKDSADRLIAASRELESLVFGVVQVESNSLAGTEVDIADAKIFLNRHKLKAARKSVKKAEQSLALLEEDVLHLRRNIAMLHRLLNEKKINEEEVETILLRLHSATGAAEIGDVGVAAGEVEHLVDDLIGGNTATLNPFCSVTFGLVSTRDGLLAVMKASSSFESLTTVQLQCPACDLHHPFRMDGRVFHLQSIFQSSLLEETSHSDLKSRLTAVTERMKFHCHANWPSPPPMKCAPATSPPPSALKTARWSRCKTSFSRHGFLRASPPIQFHSSTVWHQMKSLLFACLCASTLVQEATPEPLLVHPEWGIQKQKW